MDFDLDFNPILLRSRIFHVESYKEINVSPELKKEILEGQKFIYDLTFMKVMGNWKLLIHGPIFTEVLRFFDLNTTIKSFYELFSFEIQFPNQNLFGPVYSNRNLGFGVKDLAKEFIVEGDIQQIVDNFVESDIISRNFISRSYEMTMMYHDLFKVDLCDFIKLCEKNMHNMYIYEKMKLITKLDSSENIKKFVDLAFINGVQDE